MKILGIHDGHNAGAALVQDGMVIASVSEERISRVKNDAGYPKKAIEEVLALGNCRPDEIDIIALSSRFMHNRDFYRSWEWYKKGEKEQDIEQNEDIEIKAGFFRQRLKERKKQIAEHLSVNQDKIIIVEHHLGHAAAAYFGSPWANQAEEVLIFTMDGSGDGVSATVNIGKAGEIKRIAETKSMASLGKIYSRITYLLGMKPWEHEYKIMGLAPYSDDIGVKKSYEVLKKLIGLDNSGLIFENKTKLSTNYCYQYLRNNLENHRFDWIAGAVQKLQEELTVSWVKNSIKKTGIKKIAFGGGSFMNVKANMLISEIDGVDDIFIFPSCGDESLSIGVAYKVYADWLSKNGKKINMPAFKDIYFGREFRDEQIKKAIEEADAEKTYIVERKEDINSAVAELLANKEIVARFSGRMEWGARALGNRSILMDPRNIERIKELNAAIKHRDFWMPFAPTVLCDLQNEYFINPKKIKSPYMVMGFKTTEKGKKNLLSAIHPYDFTARPQILERDLNPDYYDLIRKFQSITGVGAVLNTSFNLHGEPIVCGPADAIDVFERSGLRYLALGNYLIAKRNNEKN